jgi:hypothetical protein
MVAAATEPILSSTELDDLLTLAQRPDALGQLPFIPWRASSDYAIGDYAVPFPRNGHLYRATAAGTSGTSPPTWPGGSGATVSEGSGKPTWQEVGAVAWLPTYDLNQAAAEGWRWKAGKVADLFNFVVDPRQQIDRAQIFEHCLSMAERYAKKVVQTISTGDWGQTPVEPLYLR